MKDLGIPVSDLIKRSGLSENTVYDILYRNKSHNTATWMAISSALEWESDFLVRVMTGEVDPSAALLSSVRMRRGRTAGELAAIDSFLREVALLAEALDRIDRKIDSILNAQRSSVGTDGPETDKK
jgi:hypothetical protein